MKLQKEIIQRKYIELDRAWHNGDNSQFEKVRFLEKLLNMVESTGVDDFTSGQGCFFSKETMKYFRSKITTSVLNKRFLIISNKNFNETKRVYRIVIKTKDSHEYLLDADFTSLYYAKKEVDKIINLETMDDLNNYLTTI